MAKPKVGIFGLTGCAGDQLVILNCEDELLDLVELIDIRSFLMASSAIEAKNFASAGSMEIEVLGLYPAGDTVAAELRIVIDGTVELRVVDVVSFDASGKITAIRAYLGRPDE